MEATGLQPQAAPGGSGSVPDFSQVIWAHPVSPKHRFGVLFPFLAGMKSCSRMGTAPLRADEEFAQLSAVFSAGSGSLRRVRG